MKLPQAVDLKNDSVRDGTASAEGRPKLKLAIIASGLGHTTRGFETSAARWYESLRKHSSNLDVRLFCGGPYDGGKSLWNMSRSSFWTLPFRWAPFLDEKQRWELCYGTEQISFWSALNFELIAWKPDAVWVKDVPLGHLLLASRVAFGLHYKVIFAHGGMLRPSTIKPFDVIQQISQEAFDEGINAGVPAEKTELISNCFPPLEIRESRAQVRQMLGLGADDWVVICVAAWNKYHKRIDYLLSEFAALNDPRAKLILCGAPEVDTKELQALGTRLLGNRVIWLSVDPQEIPSLLSASDVFVLPSLREALGNALVEAAMCGLPVLSHPHCGAQFALRDPSWMVDMSVAGNLSRRLQEWKVRPPSAESVTKLRQDVTSRFSEQSLVPLFESMVARVCERKA